MTEQKELTYEQWDEIYMPINNHIRTDSGQMFETYGDEWEFIKEQDPRYVWTWVDGDLSTLLVAGIGFVNRIGYYVCQTPWEDDNACVLVSEDIECECYSEDEDVMATRNGEYGDPNCTKCEGYGYATEYN